jgi:hypothetical protein
MTKDLEQRIRERAYDIWERTGREHGYAEAHWHAAKLELTSALPAQPADAIAVPAKAKGRRKAAAPVDAVSPVAQVASRRRRTTSTTAN